MGRNDDKIELVRLSRINRAELIALNNHPDVLRHMPLAGAVMDDEGCRAWVAGKEKQWEKNGYGPWAFVVDGRLAGWGGLQRENGDADLALVLHPEYWGWGKTLFRRIAGEAFGSMGLESITILLPLSRRSDRSVERLGFTPDGVMEVGQVPFRRYRLTRDRWNDFAPTQPPG